ncbi:hypothetical protein HPB49_015902 [Dermacentor silvarum]|uniref:Uncharacterized protein n=1 Tax=Dermacentor silvarum TaxID=543639 RepID=A0ACB8DQ31_DERSI|nr:hypothetical protein HPB49_015902 [Dermacentor silvarum]
MSAVDAFLFPPALQAELDDMDAGPILRDIMLGHYSDGGAEGDSIFSDLAVSELTASAEEARGALSESPEPVPTRRTSSNRSMSRRQSRPNYAVLAGKSRTRAKGESVSSSDEVHIDDDEDPVSPGEVLEEEEESLDAFKTRGSCMSKNAIAARENRIKKKLYVNKLERSVRHLSTENATLKRRSQDMNREIEELSEEVQYLRSVLCNVDEISSLVRSIRSARPSLATNLKNGYSLKRERVEGDHDYIGTSGKRRPPVDKKAGGVCIHVANGAVSLEFCHRCAGKSKDLREGQ